MFMCTFCLRVPSDYVMLGPGRIPGVSCLSVYVMLGPGKLPGVSCLDLRSVLSCPVLYKVGGAAKRSV